MQLLVPYKSQTFFLATKMEVFMTSLSSGFYSHKQPGSIPLLPPPEPSGFSFPSLSGPTGPFPLSLRSQHCRTFPLLFTGLKLRPPGIGIEAPVVKEAHDLLSDARAAKQSMEDVEASYASFQIVNALDEKRTHLKSLSRTSQPWMEYQRINIINVAHTLKTARET